MKNLVNKWGEHFLAPCAVLVMVCFCYSQGLGSRIRSRCHSGCLSRPLDGHQVWVNVITCTGEGTHPVIDATACPSCMHQPLTAGPPWEFQAQSWDAECPLACQDGVSFLGFYDGLPSNFNLAHFQNSTLSWYFDEVKLLCYALTVDIFPDVMFLLSKSGLFPIYVKLIA